MAGEESDIAYSHLTSAHEVRQTLRESDGDVGRALDVLSSRYWPSYDPVQKMINEIGGGNWNKNQIYYFIDSLATEFDSIKFNEINRNSDTFRQIVNEANNLETLSNVPKIFVDSMKNVPNNGLLKGLDLPSKTEEGILIVNVDPEGKIISHGYGLGEQRRLENL